MSQNQNSKANHFLSISSKKKVDLAVGGAVKSFKDSLSSSHSMCQKAKIFDPSEFKDFLKNQKIYIEMYYKGDIIKSGYEPYILAMKGEVSKKLTQKVTVILTNQITKQRFNNLNRRIFRANKNGIPIVSILWLQEIYRQKKKVQKQQFLITQNDIEDQEVEEVQQNYPDYFLQEILQDLTADLHETQNRNKPFIYLVDNKKNKKQTINGINKTGDDHDLEAIQAQSFLVTHNKIIQKVPRKKKPKKQKDSSQAKIMRQKKQKQLMEPALKPRKSIRKSVVKAQLSKIKSQPKIQTQNIKVQEKKQDMNLNQNQNQNQNSQINSNRLNKKESHVSLDFLLNMYYQAQNQPDNQICSSPIKQLDDKPLSQEGSTVSLYKNRNEQQLQNNDNSNINKGGNILSSNHDFQNDAIQNHSQNYSRSCSQSHIYNQSHHNNDNQNNNKNKKSVLSFKNSKHQSKQKIQLQIRQEMEAMIKQELFQLKYISPEQDQFCINVLCRDQKVLSYIKKLNQKYSKKESTKQKAKSYYYFNLINQPEFTDKVNRNQILRMYFQLKKSQSISQFTSDISNNSSRRSDNRQQEMVVKNSLLEIKQKLGQPQILYICDKNCKLDSLFAQLSPLPKKQIVDFKIIKAIADTNSHLSHQYEHEKQSQIQMKERIEVRPYTQIAKLFPVKAIINFQLVNKKKLTILDSTILKNSLEYIIEKLGGTLILPLNYVVGKQKCDVVITSKRSIKTFESGRKNIQKQWQVDTQQFIDSLIKIQA